MPTTDSRVPTVPGTISLRLLSPHRVFWSLPLPQLSSGFLSWLLLVSLFWGNSANALADEPSDGPTEQPAREQALALDIEKELEQALEKGGANRAELDKALDGVPATQRAAMKFLIAYMPTNDLQSLDHDFLTRHVELAFEAKQAAKWGASIPDAIFFNDLLPYANVNERRDDVRGELRERFWPAVQELESPSEAAAKLNHEVFQQLNVKYSTQRRRADQGPRESMETGLASCTGLSILLIDACRACGIPARFVGTPLWSDGSGNHSWVEIWDDGWQFTGAAEPTGSNLNQAWFTDRAAKSTAGAKHGIFAVSYQRTQQKFPLVWLRGEHEIFAVEVTEHYAKAQKSVPGLVELQFRALQAPGANRCQANLVVSDQAGQVVFRGQTKDESSDANDHLTAKLPPGEYSLELRTATGVVRQQVTAGEDGQLISLVADDPTVDAASADPLQLLQAYCDAQADAQPEAVAEIAEQAFAQVALTAEQAAQAQEILIGHYQKLMEATRREEHAAKRIVIGDLTMKYETRVFGERPAAGHCLVFSMHGGGGAPARVNEQQWENQKRLYELEEGIYLAPRGPTDTWNLWHEAHIDQFFTRIIANMIAFEGVDPNRIYLTGYSAGGDGVYQLAPRMADQLAAAAMMAGHPNETQPLGLRNLPFTLHVGGNDSAYNRNTLAAEWKEKLAALRVEDPQGYEHWAKVHEGKGHWMDRQDAEGVTWMMQFKRNLLPERIVWLQDDVTHSRFYWLSVPADQATGGSQVVAVRNGNQIAIEKGEPAELVVLLRDDMVDLEQPVTITVGETQVFQGQANRTIANLARTLAERGDPLALFSASVTIKTR